MRIGHVTFTLGLVLAAASGCTREPAAGATSCAPNSVRSCRCDGALGSQRCDARGQPVGSCDCSSAIAAPSAGRSAARVGAGGNSASNTSAAVGGTNARGGSGGARSEPAASDRVAAGSGGAAAATSPGMLSVEAGRGGAVAGSVASSGSAQAEITAEPSDEASYLFDPAQLRTYDIRIAEADLASIDRMPGAEQAVPATLEFEGKTYGPLRVRYKGSAGAFVYPCTMGLPDAPKLGKCSLKLDFNDTDPSARFFGLKKLNLHAMNADVSMLRDRLGYRMFRDMGIPASRAMHARVLINGRLEGLFIAVEQVDGRFTRARFAEGGQGNIYKEVWPLHDDPAVYVKSLESNTAQPNVQRMLDFKAAVDSSQSAAESFLDRAYLSRLLAVDRVIMNDDGFLHFWCNDGSTQGNNPGSFGNHNYYWYEELQRARLWLVPWDLDNSFDNSPAVRIEPAYRTQLQAAQCVCTEHPVSGPQRPSACDPLVALLLSWRAEYEAAVDAFLAGPYAKPRVDALLDEWTTQIRPAVVEAAGLKLAPSESEWAEAVSTLRGKIERSRANRGLGP